MVLKTNSTCYFVCDITHEESIKYIDSPKLSLKYLDSKTGEYKTLENVYIDNRTNVIVGKDENGSTYVIDDGYRNSMIRAGYMVYKNYDEIQCTDKAEGNVIHEKLLDYISNAILDYDGDVKVFGYTDSAPFEYADTYYLEKSGYRFTIKLYNNFQIVKINQDRKINGLQFYPFDKNMDNYGTLYVSIYCQKIKETDIKNTTISDGILKHIIDSTEDIKFVSMDIKQPLYYSIGGTNNVSN